MGHARPAPALDCGVAGGCAERGAVAVREREDLFQALLEHRRVAAREAREMPQTRRVVLLEPLRDLREAGVVRDDRRATRRGRLGRHHPEGLGEDRGHDCDVGKRGQMDEMAVLERAGEENRQPFSLLLELRPVVAEADDDRSCVHASQRLEEQVDALVVDELAEVHDRGAFVGEEAREPVGIALVGETLVLVAGIRGIVSCLLEQRRQRLGSRLGAP